jgi:hypothetical protein
MKMGAAQQDRADTTMGVIAATHSPNPVADPLPPEEAVNAFSNEPHAEDE